MPIALEPSLLSTLAKSGSYGREFEQAAAPFMKQAGQAYNLPPGLLETLAMAESTYNPRAQSVYGAQGLMQIEPNTAKKLGIDPWDPEQSIWGAARYLDERRTKRGGSIVRALEDYNRGPNRPGPMPDTTKDYIRKIMNATPQEPL